MAGEVGDIHVGPPSSLAYAPWAWPCAGRSLEVVLLRAYPAMLWAAKEHYSALGGAASPTNPVDRYVTLLGCFNALRELGGSRSIVEDEARRRWHGYSGQQIQALARAARFFRTPSASVRVPHGGPVGPKLATRVRSLELAVRRVLQTS